MPPRHRQRLPGHPRRRVDGAHLQVPRPDRRHHRPRAERPREAARLPLRHHLRHQQRVRLRLPARQHEGLDRALRAARAALRDRRRGRLDPHRRGAHAAHHLGPGRGVGRSVLPRQPDHPVAQEGRRLHRRREGPLGDAHRRGRRARREEAQPRSTSTTPRTSSGCTTCTQALRAHTLYKRDVNYLVEEGKVLIIDEHTGRKMPGRRWSDGLHQAIEAKENVTIEEENQTLATVTFQNLFRMYHKLGGMTGTADTEADRVPPDLQARRRADPDQQADGPQRQRRPRLQERARQVPRGASSEIVERHEQGPADPRRHHLRREVRSAVARCSSKKGIPHNVLNAKYHMREAEIVAQAGRKGAVTISTNMAGRGTDILLGGNAEFMARAEVGGHEAAAIPGAVDENTPEYKAALAKYKAQCDAEKQEVRRRRRPAHPRHRAPRVAPHRQPAARPRRSPGRSRLVALLPVARGRSAAHLRRRAHHRPDGAARHGRGRADRARPGQPRHRERAAQGRGAQLRHPQEPARLRRRDEPAAQGDLRPAQADPRGALRPRAVRGGQEEGQGAAAAARAARATGPSTSLAEKITAARGADRRRASSAGVHRERRTARSIPTAPTRPRRRPRARCSIRRS